MSVEAGRIHELLRRTLGHALGFAPSDSHNSITGPPADDPEIDEVNRIMAEEITALRYAQNATGKEKK